MTTDQTYFSKTLIEWYIRNKRDLPWRKTSDPYRIWLSEIILQQTRVVQGLPYYNRFIKNFPDVQALANSEESQVLKLWQGLGYYSRARNLHSTAKQIANELDGVFPATYEELIKLRGIGDYTASAIVSICHSTPRAVVDGNVYRVLSRVFGIGLPINTTRGIKIFKEQAQYLLDKSDPGTYNQAIMEFGARYCVPKNPNCSECIFNTICEAYLSRNVGSYPVKIKNGKVRQRFFNYLVFISEDDKTVVQQRTQKGIWQNLFEFPLVESTSDLTIDELGDTLEFIRLMEDFSTYTITLYNEHPIIHKLSHQHLNARFWIVEVPVIKENGTPISRLNEFAVPVLIENFISSFSLMNI